MEVEQEGGMLALKSFSPLSAGFQQCEGAQKTDSTAHVQKKKWVLSNLSSTKDCIQ